MDLSPYLPAHVGPAQLIGATFVVAFVSGLVPFVNIEAYLLVTVALGGPASTLALALASASGQMVGKGLLYFTGSGFLRLPIGRHRRKIEELSARLRDKRKVTASLLFISAFVGLPPFYAVSVLAGGLRVSFLHFLVSGFVGRFLRFGLIAFSPRLVTRLFP